MKTKKSILKKSTTIILLMTVFSFSQNRFSQKEKINFNKITQRYYLEKDDKLVQHSIDYFNNPNLNSIKNKNFIIGFYGALFLESSEIKKEFKDNIDKFKNKDIRNFFNLLIDKNIKTTMREYPISPAFNDMNWAAFFSTGKTKYIDHIIKNSSEAGNRVDIKLFFTGTSAKWSLCLYSKRHKKVKEYLQSNYKELAEEIIKSNPVDFKKNVIKVIKEQRKKGIWIK